MKGNDTFKTRHFTCETCRTVRTVLQWNYDPAPTCCGAAMHEGVEHRDTIQIITDDVPGGFTVENGFTTPQTFYSKSEHRRALATGLRSDGVRIGRGGLRIGDKGEWKHARRA